MVDMAIVSDIKQEFYNIKPYLYYDIDINDVKTKIEFNDIDNDVVILADYEYDVHATKFCAKFDPVTKKFYGPVLVEHNASEGAADDYTGMDYSAEEKTFIVGTFLESKPIDLWTYSSLFYHDVHKPEYSIVAKVKYDFEGNVKKTKIWNPSFDGNREKPVVKVNGFYPLEQIFIFS